jgi:hypothetical protein
MACFLTLYLGTPVRNLGNLFILINVELCIGLYHKIRNYVIKMVHRKLSVLHNKLKSIQVKKVFRQMGYLS